MSQLDHRIKFYEEELVSAKKNLFNASSIRRMKALEQRVKFLNEKLDELSAS